MEKLKNAYALLIGVGKDLPVSARDAEAIYNVLIDKTRAGYLPENIFLLTDEKATRKEIIKAFDMLIEKTDDNASVMLYYSGHGGCYSDNTFLKKKDWKPEDQNQKYFHLCPFDYDPVDYENTWIKAEEVKKKIGDLKSRRLIFFLDCCHAAGITKDAQITLNSSTIKLTQVDGLAQHLDDGRGMSIISSCREDQLSYIMEGDSNSLYTKCMIEVLNGKGKTNYEDPYIRISEVVQYIFKKVPEGNPEQNPYANLQIYDDFILSYIPENLRNNNTQEREIATVNGSTQDIGKGLVTKFRESDTANSVVLFIHGFSGEASNTFANIPHFLIQDKRMDGWDMFPIGYSDNINPEMGKSVWASLTDIKRNSTYLTTSLKHKFSKYKRIAIVAHSLGGLVAQQAILGLSLKEMEKITHLILFGTPSGGLSEKSIQKLNQSHLKDLSESGGYIKKLRGEWAKRFSSCYPFYFRTVSATKDSYVPISSSLNPFLSNYQTFVEGDHFSMVNVWNQNNDSYNLIVSALTENKFFNQYSSFEEINIAMGEYDEVIKKLLPQIKKLDTKGLEQLIFALEGVDRVEEALNIAKGHVLTQNNSDLMGVIGGRYKRKYLNTFSNSDAENSLQYYSKGLSIARAANDFKQIYYLAINMAFLSIFYKQDENAMISFAQISVEATKNDPFNSLWKLATLGEANIYLGEFEESKIMYSQAAKMSGIREKLSIYGNALNAYTCLMHSNNPNEDFIKFLRNSFLS